MVTPMRDRQTDRQTDRQIKGRQTDTGAGIRMVQSYLVFTRKSIHFHQLVMIVKYQLNACQQIIRRFLFFQAILLSVVLPQALQSLHRYINYI